MNTIDIGKSVRDFTQSDELSEYTNVEFQIDSETSVFAKAVGDLVPPLDEWKIWKKQSDSVTASADSVEFTTSGGSGWGLSVFSNPALFDYRSAEGRTVNVSFTVTGLSGSGWKIVAGMHLQANREVGSRIYYKDFADQTGGTFEYSFTVGESWFNSDNVGAFLGMHIYLFAESACKVRVSNVQCYIDDDSATTLVTECPFGTAAMARSVLKSLQGFHYKPYEATGARLDMAAEIGDTVVIDSSGYGLYAQDINFGSDTVSRISAPSDQELEHEFPYVSSSERNFKREVATLRAEIDIRSGEIEAKVEQRVPSEYGNPSSFGWKLQSNNFSVYANGQTVLKVTQSGAEITGKVVATSGNIGGCEIVNGVLQVSSANIGTIRAEQITVGTLNADRIPILNSSKLGENSVGNYQLGSNAVYGYNIVDGAVGTNQIYGGAVSTGKLANYAVTTSKISDGAVTMSKLSSDARGIMNSVAKLFNNDGSSSNTIYNPRFWNMTVTGQIRWNGATNGGGRSYILGLYDTKPSVGKYVVAIPF